MRKGFSSQARRWRWYLGAALLPTLLIGCTHTERGLVGGGAVGATAGALAGSLKGKAGTGAAIGGAIGALAGGLTGKSMDNMEARHEAEIRQAQAAAHPPLSLEDVQQLSARGTSDTVIINQIRHTRSVYHLTAAQIGWLQDHGVSDRVITEMQQTALRRPPPVVYERRPVVVRPVRPVYVVEPCRPPVGVGIHFRSGRPRRRCWH